MMERYLLRYFLAVVDQGGFSRAAVHCNVSQPTLSVGIAKLEQAVGAQLFTRSPQRVQLTPAGTRLLSHARRIEAEFNLAQRSVAAGDGVAARVGRLGVLASIPGALVAQAVAQLDPEQRGAIEIFYGSERDLIGRLERGRIDGALSLLRGGDRFPARAVAEEGYGVALATAHRLADRAEVAAEELADEVMIVRRHCEALADTSRHFTQRGIRPPFALRATNDERVLQMVAGGLGLTVMPCSYRWPGVARPALAGFTVTRTIGYLHQPGGGPAQDALAPLLARLEPLLGG